MAAITMASSADLTDNNKKPRVLHESYKPGPYTVIIVGRRHQRNHTGNKLLARIVKDELNNFKKAQKSSKSEDKYIFLRRIVYAIKRSNDDGIGFVTKKDPVTGRWLELTGSASVAVVMRCFRYELGRGETSSRACTVSNNKKTTKQQKRQQNTGSGEVSGNGIPASSVFSSLPPLPGRNRKGQGLSVDDAIALARQRNEALMTKGGFLAWKDVETTRRRKKKKTGHPCSSDDNRRSCSIMRASNPNLVLDLQPKLKSENPRSSFDDSNIRQLAAPMVADTSCRQVGQPRFCEGYDHGDQNRFEPWNSNNNILGTTVQVDHHDITISGGVHPSFVIPTNDLEEHGGCWETAMPTPYHHHHCDSPAGLVAASLHNNANKKGYYYYYYDWMDLTQHRMDALVRKRHHHDTAAAVVSPDLKKNPLKDEIGRSFVAGITTTTIPRRLQLDPPAQRLD